MGQAKARRAADLAGTPWRERSHGEVPKKLIARAIREPLLHGELSQIWETSGSCVQQSEVGRRILKDRFGLDAVILVGDLMRPMGDGMHHTYTGEDGKISVETGACHA